MSIGAGLLLDAISAVAERGSPGTQTPLSLILADVRKIAQRSGGMLHAAELKRFFDALAVACELEEVCALLRECSASASPDPRASPSVASESESPNRVAVSMNAFALWAVNAVGESAFSRAASPDGRRSGAHSSPFRIHDGTVYMAFREVLGDTPDDVIAAFREQSQLAGGPGVGTWLLTCTQALLCVDVM